MTNSEVKELFIQVTNVINYLVEKEIKNFKLFYGLNRNHDNLERESNMIDKIVKTQLPELFEIEQQAAELLNEKNKALEQENATLEEKKPLLNMIDAIKLLPQEQQDKHTELMGEYNKILNQEASEDFKLYMLKKEDIEDITIDFWAVRLLSRFINE